MRDYFKMFPILIFDEISSMNTRNNKDRVIHFLCQPQGGKAYLLNALNSNSETVFIEALHNIIDAISKELTSKSI